MPQTEVLLRVSAVAKQAEVPARTVRFYADIGLLRPIARGENGYRFFGEDAVERVTSDCADAHRAFAEALRIRIGAVEQQIRELSSMRTQLVDLAVESDAGCTDALCLCRTHPVRASKGDA